MAACKQIQSWSFPTEAAAPPEAAAAAAVAVALSVAAPLSSSTIIPAAAEGVALLLQKGASTGRQSPDCCQSLLPLLITIDAIVRFGQLSQVVAAAVPHACDSVLMRSLAGRRRCGAAELPSHAS